MYLVMKHSYFRKSDLMPIVLYWKKNTFVSIIATKLAYHNNPNVELIVKGLLRKENAQKVLL